MNKDRRTFIKELGLVTGGITLLSGVPSFLYAEIQKFDFKISLAQWSLHKALFSNKISALDFPLIAKKDFGFDAVEYVNQFFKDKAADKTFLAELKKRCDDNGVKSVLIMIDGEGYLGASDSGERKSAIENHYRWIEAAKFLDCQSIRVNLHGKGPTNEWGEKEWKEASIESLRKLSEFADEHGINVLAENHGGYSSNPLLITEVISKVNHKRCGILADFNNFCIRREKNDLWESPCAELYDRYKGVKRLLPHTKAISAKTIDFDDKGNETSIDYGKMLKLVKDAKYKGYISVEYEGNRLSEEEGIRTTKKLLERLREEL